MSRSKTRTPKVLDLRRYDKKGWAWTILAPGKKPALQRTGRNGLGIFDITKNKAGKPVVKDFEACETISGQRRKLKRVAPQQLVTA